LILNIKRYDRKCYKQNKKIENGIKKKKSGNMIFQGITENLILSLIFFILVLAIIIFLTLFIMNWGDKIQVVKKRKLFFSISLLPGSIYVVVRFLNVFEDFSSQFINELFISMIISLVSAFIIKQLSYRTIPRQMLADNLIELEKGKDLLEIENLKVYYPLRGGFLRRQIGSVKAVDGVSLMIKTGQTLGLVGESGCGKSTLAKAILGLVDIESGEMKFKDDKIDVDRYSRYLRQKIQIVYQDPDASLNPRMKVIDIVTEPLKNLFGITGMKDLRKHALRLLNSVSLKREHLDRYPDEFSGGQKQRIVIARALACNPELIILDEPTSALDVSVQAQILNLLKDLQRTYGYGFLFITHNLSVVNHIADHIAVMYLGRIVELGSKDQIFARPTHPYTQALLNSRIKIDPDSQDIKYVIEGEVPSPINPPTGCHFNPRCVSDARTKECEFDNPRKIKIEDDHFIWCINEPIGIGIDTLIEKYEDWNGDKEKKS